MGATSVRLECGVAARLAGDFSRVRSFGSSDCRCRGHLVHSTEKASLAAAALDALRTVGCGPRVVMVVDVGVLRLPRSCL